MTKVQREYYGLDPVDEGPEPDGRTPGQHRFALATERLGVSIVNYVCGHRVKTPYGRCALLGPVDEVLARESLIRSVPCKSCREKGNATNG